MEPLVGDCIEEAAMILNKTEQGEGICQSLRHRLRRLDKVQYYMYGLLAIECVVGCV